MPKFPSWRVMTCSQPADRWDIHLITHDEGDAREQAGHLKYKGLDVRLQHREDEADEWEDVQFVEGSSEM